MQTEHMADHRCGGCSSGRCEAATAGTGRCRWSTPPCCGSPATTTKEGNVLFNDDTFYLWLYGIRHMVKDHSDSEREKTCCHHIGYSFRLAARIILYAPSHRQDNTYHGLCYTSRGALACTRNSSMCPPRRIDRTTHRTMSKRSYHSYCPSMY